MEYLEKALAHDRILYQYFIDIGNGNKASTVKFRIECLEKEINQDVEGEEDEEDN